MGSPTNWRLTGCELIYMRKGKKSMEDEQFYQTNNEWDITKQKNKKETNTQESSHQEAVKTNNSQNIISLQGPLREGTWEDVRGRGRTWKDEGGRETTWKDVRRRGRTREHVRGCERTRKDVENEGGRLYTWTPPVVLCPPRRFWRGREAAAVGGTSGLCPGTWPSHVELKYCYPPFHSPL